MIFVNIESVKKKYTPKNATVTVTTMVVEITSARDGQFTCRISTRTSCRNERNRFGYPPSFCTGSKSANPLTRWDSSSRLVRIASAISLRHFVSQPCNPAAFPARRFTNKLAGEEGFEPPLSVLETDGLPLNLLPFTLRTRQWRVRRVYPTRRMPVLSLISRNFLARLQPLISFSRQRTASEDPQHSDQTNSTGRR